jgi:hypothetical protein
MMVEGMSREHELCTGTALYFALLYSTTLNKKMDNGKRGRGDFDCTGVAHYAMYEGTIVRNIIT